MASDLVYCEKIMKLDGEERRKKADEVLDTSAPGTNMIPLYDAWAQKYDEVCLFLFFPF